MGGILIQRIARSTDCTEANIVARFDFDYMGSAEFLWGILPASLELMRSRDNNVSSFWAGNKEFWFVGELASINEAGRVVANDMAGNMYLNGQRYKEWPRLKHEVESDSPNIIGWWWLSQNGWPNSKNATDPTWCVFLHHSDAVKWHECLVVK